MGDSNFFKGTSADQDRRFTDKESKLLKTLKFPPEFETKIDMRKVKLEIIRPWITSKLIELLGSSDDDVLIEYAMSLLEDTSQPVPDPRKIQIQMQAFLPTTAPGFMVDLWKLLIEAQANPLGVPQSMIEEYKKQEANRPSIRMGSRFDAGPPSGDSGGRGPHDRRNDRGDGYGDRGRGGGERGRGRGRGRGGYRGGEGRYGDRYGDHERGPPRRRSPPRYRSRSRSPPRRYRSRSHSPRLRRRSRSNSSRSRSPHRRGYKSPSSLRRRRQAYRSRSRSPSPYGNGGGRRSPPRRGGGRSSVPPSPRGGEPIRKRRGSDASSIHSSRAGTPPRRAPANKDRRRPRSASRSWSRSPRSPPRSKSKKMRSPSPPRKRARRSPSPGGSSPDVPVPVLAPARRHRSRSSTPRYRKDGSRTPSKRMEDDDERQSPRKKGKWDNDEMDVDKTLAKSDLDRLESEAKEKALRAKVIRTRKRE